jgi:CRISPR-associated endonuclease/helicase Cas3
VAKKARALAERVGLAAMADLFDRAGLMHDQGKRREVWQRAFGGNVDKPIAKSKAPVNLRLLDGYRHELGSIVDAGAESDDLVLHLVASHHKAARPFFRDAQLDRDNVTKSEAIALEAARRYAKLQRRFGPWGLAYLEAIFKRADALASDDEGGGASE